MYSGRDLSRCATATMSSQIFARRDSSVLADDGDRRAQAGSLDSDVHLPGEWFSSLVGFIGSVLPGWRDDPIRPAHRSEEHTSELQSLMRISYAVFCLQKQK